MPATIETETVEELPAVGSVNLLTDVITKDRVLPAGYDGWAIRTVRPDFRSSRGYRYPYPGEVARAAGPFNANGNECPNHEGDGICAAGTWAGMASGGVPANVLLLVAYKDKDVLGGSIREKLRLRKFLVVDVIDGCRLLIESGAYANLRYADLRYADLRYANLRYADLRYANLASANLRYANLRYADLRSANLASANLRSANLRYADLASANLRYANLRYADLRYADLRYADLGYANLGSRGVSALSESYWNESQWADRGDGIVVPR